VNPWLIAAGVLIICLAPCLISCKRGDPLHRLVALEAAGVIVCMVLLLLAEGYHRIPFTDLALALAIVNFGGNLAFARFLERWL
jgi:multisubunit Na+/H+ antiporter MnhF subunit